MPKWPVLAVIATLFAVLASTFLLGLKQPVARNSPQDADTGLIDDQLANLLLNTGEFGIDGIGQADLDKQNDGIHSSPAGRVSPTICQGISHAADPATYQHAGFKDMDEQMWRGFPVGDAVLIDQAVAKFPNPWSTSAFWSRSAQSWGNCSRERSYSQILPSNRALKWSVSATIVANGVLSADIALDSQINWSCQRALAVEANFIVDIATCSDRPQQYTAISVAEKIRKKIRTQYN